MISLPLPFELEVVDRPEKKKEKYGYPPTSFDTEKLHTLNSSRVCSQRNSQRAWSSAIRLFGRAVIERL